MGGLFWRKPLPKQGSWRYLKDVRTEGEGELVSNRGCADLQYKPVVPERTGGEKEEKYPKI